MRKGVQEVSVADAKSNLSRLLSVVEEGGEILITRRGKPIAVITRPPITESDGPKLGTLAGQVQYMPGWDEPVTEQELLGE